MNGECDIGFSGGTERSDIIRDYMKFAMHERMHTVVEGEPAEVAVKMIEMGQMAAQRAIQQGLSFEGAMDIAQQLIEFEGEESLDRWLGNTGDHDTCMCSSHAMIRSLGITRDQADAMLREFKQIKQVEANEPSSIMQPHARHASTN